MTTDRQPDALTPDQVAIKQNFWTISIQRLDSIIDNIRKMGDLFAESDYPEHAVRLREALVTVRLSRDELLAENYDANRQNRMVRK